ncbi:hypothetical protein ISS03_03960 [Patescibacteria group bacterium]|nr:hypothetical protein [Patescibacteria group bacterium]
MNICIFGDSITYGAFDEEKGGWAIRLRLYLEKINPDIELHNLGISGENSNDLLKRFNNEVKVREPDLILIAIGINDSQYLIEEDRHSVLIDEFNKNIETLINEASKFTSRIIFIGLTPVDEDKTNPIPWNTNKIYNNSYIKLYDQKIRKVCEEAKLEYINIYDEFIKHKNYTELLPDGLHPNSQGHQLLFKVVKNNLKFSKNE